VIFKLKYNENGIVVLEECFLQEDYIEETKVPKPKTEKKEEKKDDKRDEKKDDKKEDKNEDKKEEAANPAPPTPTPEEFEIKQSKKTRQTPLKYEHVLLEKTTQKEVENYFDIECKMRNQDKIINETY
jgi:hypothetical protein